MDGGVTPAKPSPGPHCIIAVSRAFWAVMLSKTGYIARRESDSPLLSDPGIKITAKNDTQIAILVSHAIYIYIYICITCVRKQKAI